MAYITDSEAARGAFQTATTRAQEAVKGLFNSFGFTRQSPQGSWSTASAASAFDPSNFVTFNSDPDPGTARVTVNTEGIRAAGSGAYGTAFGYNRLSDVMGSAASREALAKSALRGRGIGRGGLVSQAAQSSEAMQGRETGQVGAEFLASLGDIYGQIGASVGDVTTANIESSGAGAVAQAASTPVMTAPPAASAPAAAATVPRPTGAGRMYERRGPWQYLGANRGWVKN